MAGWITKERRFSVSKYLHSFPFLFTVSLWKYHHKYTTIEKLEKIRENLEKTKECKEEKTLMHNPTT